MMIFLMTTVGCGGSDNTPLPKYSQSDFTGTWHAYLLTAGTMSEWQYVTVTFSSTGTLSFADCHDSTPSTTCPTGPIVWTINSSGGGTGSQMIIALKEGTYTGDELQSKSLVYHELAVGVSNQWIYGTGATDSSGELTISSYTDPSGTHSSGEDIGTLSVNTSETLR
jgi:hypothetical protein